MILTIYMSMFLVLACVDMGLKQYIEDTFEENEERETKLPGLVFRKNYNKGFAFNVLENAPGIIRKSSVFSAAGILLYDCWIFSRKKRPAGKLGMTLVSAGAVSNLYDRLFRRKVIDYIGFRNKREYFSKLTANLADVYLTAGAVLCGLSEMAYKRKITKRK